MLILPPLFSFSSAAGGFFFDVDDADENGNRQEEQAPLQPVQQGDLSYAQREEPLYLDIASRSDQYRRLIYPSSSSQRLGVPSPPPSMVIQILSSVLAKVPTEPLKTFKYIVFTADHNQQWAPALVAGIAILRDDDTCLNVWRIGFGGGTVQGEEEEGKNAPELVQGWRYWVLENAATAVDAALLNDGVDRLDTSALVFDLVGKNVATDQVCFFL